MSLQDIEIAIAESAARADDAPLLLFLSTPHTADDAPYASGQATETGLAGDLTLYWTATQGGTDSHGDYAPGQ